MIVRLKEKGGRRSLKNLNFYLIDSSQPDLIKPLWKKLNEYHKDRSEYFADHFAANTFAERMERVLAKDLDLRIEVVEDTEKENIIGYCMSSVNQRQKGEIDSIYVEAEYRGQQIGGQLMKNALEWMEKQEVEKTTIKVSWGNKDTVKFYTEYGFKPRAVILEK